MSSRYQTLYKSGEALYAENVPVLIMAGALLKDSETGRVIAQLKFKSISEKVISAMKVTVRAFEPNGDEIAGVSDFAYLDLNAARDSEFCSKTPIALPNDNARKISAAVTEVTFANGETKKYSPDAMWRPLPATTPLEDFLPSAELVSQYKADVGADVRNAPTENEVFWYCVCGAINQKGEKRCHKCGKDLAALLTAADGAVLYEHIAARKEKEEAERLEQERHAEADRLERERLAEQKRIAKEKAAKRGKRIAAIVSPIVVACIAFVIVLLTVIIPNGKYNSALELYNTGKYDEAIAAFQALDGYRDSDAQIAKCETAIKDAKYNEALKLFQEGKYEESKAAFRFVYSYKDSATQIEKCDKAIQEAKYNAAIELYNKKRYEEAYKSFRDLGNYLQSPSHLNTCLTDWVDQIINMCLYGDAGTFRKTVALSSSQAALVYEKVLSYIKSHDEFDYWDDAWYGTHNSELVLNLLESLSSSYGDTGKLIKFFKDAKSGDIHPVQDWILFNLDLIDTLWEYGFMKDFSQGDSMISAVLTGYWETSDGNYHIEFYDNGDSISCSNNLPKPTKPSNASYYSIESMVYVWKDYDDKVLTNVFKISFANFDTIEVYCYSDGKTYTLVR